MSRINNGFLTLRDLKEIQVVGRELYNDDTIRQLYLNIHGNLVCLESYIVDTLKSFWIDCNPYLDKPYLDVSYVVVGDKILNVDDAWQYVKDCLTNL